MQVTIEHSAMLRALTNVQGVVERRPSIPILAHVMIEVEAERCRLTATNMDIQARATAPAIVAGPGKTTVHALILYDIVRHLPEGSQIDMTLEEEDKTLIIKSGRARFSLQTLPPEEFPDLSAGPFPHEFSLSPADLRRMIEKTQFAISAEESRYYLNGIYFHAPKQGEDTIYRAVATDGHRLAWADCPLPEEARGAPGVIVLRKTIAELRRFLAGAIEEVRISVSKTMIRYHCGDATFTSKVIDGTFPDYDRVVPKKNDRMLVMSARDLLRSVPLVAAVAHDDVVAPLKMSLKPGTIVLSVSVPDYASASEEVDVEYDSAEMEIGFNAKYLREITGHMEETVRLEMDEPGSPVIIRDCKDDSVLYVLMPMRV